MAKTNSISIANLGQLRNVDITFGDFNVFVGPQASGKSIFFQTLKLLLDGHVIKRTIGKYGFEWGSNEDAFLQLYFGEGMSKIWRRGTHVSIDHKESTVKGILSSKSTRKEQLFLIPAQRVITIQQGWPRNFMNYETSDPYVVKSFSENLRIMMERGLGRGKGAIFPQTGRMKKALRDELNSSIFYDASVDLDKSSAKKRFVLSVGRTNLPYMTWSAGQREFMPLLLGLYYLMPSSRIPTRQGIKWVVIEEPEMGLHPKAIKSLLLVFLDLLYRGYKVLISTHSPVILELVWLIQNLKKLKVSTDYLFEIFELNKASGMGKVFQDVMQKEYKTFYFDRPGETGVVSKDISSLDPFSEEAELSEWGGLSSFSNRVSELLSKAYAKANNLE